MSDPRKIYWDTSCFLCLLNPEEKDRRYICEDVLRHAEMGNVEIWISMWVMVEVIRPRKPADDPLPEWAIKCIKAVAEAKTPLEDLWKRFQGSVPKPKLTSEEIDKIEAMFEWPFLKKMYVDERVAKKAVDVARETGLKPGDAVHAATAILAGCNCIQRWDKDFKKAKKLMDEEEPKRITVQGDMRPQLREATGDVPKQETVTASPEVSGGSDGHTEGQAGAETKAQGENSNEAT